MSIHAPGARAGRARRSRRFGSRALHAARVCALPCAIAAFQIAGVSLAVAGDTGISINGAQLPGLPRTAPANGFAAGAPGLPNGAATVDQEVPGTHGAPSGPAAAESGKSEQGQGSVSVTGWTEADIRAGQEQCRRALAGLDAQFTFVPQVKSGPCGTPAPIELSGFGKNLAISPPVIVTCDIAATLHGWMKSQVQPLAKRHLGSPIVQINTMSSYACRNRYGARNAPLSQHAFANAIDIRGFVTAKGLLLDVEQHWGPTTKELAAYRASLPPAPVLAATSPIVAAGIPNAIAAATSAGQPVGNGWSTTLANGPAIMPAARDLATKGNGILVANTPVAAAAVPAGDFRLRPSFPVVMKTTASGTSTIKIVANGQPAVLGPPPVQPGQALDERAHFLREVWQGACGPFLTVLGPEANRAHRNHFHVDLAQRKSGAFCQ